MAENRCSCSGGSFPNLSVGKESVCIDTYRVLDSCRDKDCFENTRVYVTAAVRDGQAVISFKNVSRDELNISPDELMERFVRGDASRHSEGSGLGLSIARSLVQLQGGTFALSIDADLFRADIVFPLI